MFFHLFSLRSVDLHRNKELARIFCEPPFYVTGHMIH